MSLEMRSMQIGVLFCAKARVFSARLKELDCLKAVSLPQAAQSVPLVGRLAEAA